MHIIEPHILIKHRQLCSKNMYPKVSFACTIYGTSKHCSACVGACACGHTPLLQGPVFVYTKNLINEPFNNKFKGYNISMDTYFTSVTAGSGDWKLHI